MASRSFRLSSTPLQMLGGSLLAMAVSLSGTPAHAQQAAPAPTALPTGGSVVAGQASVQQQGAHMDILQGSERAIIAWQRFDVGKDAQVSFHQPNANAVALNRVIGSDLSTIAGRIDANGKVFLVNPNGVMFAKGSQVNVGGLVASTMDIDDADFLAGRLKFQRRGATGSIVNEGEIRVADGGIAALLGTDIQNVGLVTATRGTVVLAAGEAVTLSFNGGVVNVAVDPANIDTLIANRQLIEAPGGQIVMSARAANALLGAAINNVGVISASSLSNVGGSIKLVGDHVANSGSVSADGVHGGSIDILARQHDAFGTISALGTRGAGGIVSVAAHRTVMTEGASIDASGVSAGGTVTLTHDLGNGGGAYLSGSLKAAATAGSGGSVTVTGGQLDLFGTRIAASGATAGGTVKIGGGYQGQDTLVPNATKTTGNMVDIDVSATRNGAGGLAVVWSDGTTVLGGKIDARGRRVA